MSTGARSWPVRLTAAAEADFEEILRWTVDQFGEAQARIYAGTVSAALNDLAAGPTVIGAKKRDDILKEFSHCTSPARAARGVISSCTASERRRTVT